MKSRWRWILAGTITSLLIPACLTGAYRLYDQKLRFPELAPYDRYFVTRAPADPDAPRVSATFFGTSGVLLDDGKTRVFIDPFFSRPEHNLAVSALRPIEPIPYRISWCLQQAGIDDLDAVVVTHSHYDHSMDAPHVAALTGAQLLGTGSTANVARGWGLPEDRIEIIGDGTRASFGDFVITFVETVHGPPACADKDKSKVAIILEPLIPPVEPFKYEDGGTFSVHVAHPLGSLVVHSSPGVNEGDLSGLSASAIFLGIPRIGNVKKQCRERYYRETVEMVGATRVFPVHWDYWSRPLDQPLAPLPSGSADFDKAMDFLIEKIESTPGTRMEMLHAFETTVLFEGGSVPAPPPLEPSPSDSTQALDTI